mmetsp:Transcript_2207/g.2415  ORF Transcript_2207/g.2415 Transcript_2207/m.2415 type:complete len:963 (-) Transcript_2207:5204-8092(-)
MLRIRSAYGSRVANVSVYRYFSSTLRNSEALIKELDPKVYKSHVKTKLNYFLETGQILKYSPDQYQRRINKIKNKLSYKINLGSYSLQKALLVLRSKYDNILQTDSGEIISTEKLTPTDLNIDSQKSLSIFKALVNIKKINRKPLDEKLILKLLGTNSTQLNDPFLVTRDVLKLLERDKEITRAVYLAKLAGSESGVVGMNAVLQWLLERGDTKAAFKNFQDRKKWGIPITEHTYTILFDGMAKAHEWGKVSNEMTEKCMQIFESFKENSNNKAMESNENKADKRKASKCTIVHFNSCLSLLLKNFKNDQQYAWTFFNLLLPDSKGTSPNLIADSQTFTIFLNGIKKYSQHKSELVIKNDNLTKQVKTLKLLHIQGNLIQIAELILGKIMAAATPPVPPTKEEVEENPDCLITYRQKIKRQLVDIDQTFVSVFVSCFINNNAGTGIDITSGSHYKYIQSGLKYLSIWCPEVQSLFHFVEKTSKDNDKILLKPSDTLKIGTDSRLKNAVDSCAKSDLKFLDEGVVLNDILPQSIVTPEQLEHSKINPLVIFPPPLLSHNKTKAIFSGKQKRLVDFTRPTFADIRSILLYKQYKTSRGKFGKKLPQSSNVTLDKKNGINKFILMQTLDGLLQLGKLREFYLAIWYCLTKWGGIYVSRTDILKVANDIGVSKGVLSENYFPHYIYPNKASEKNALDDTDSNNSFIEIPPQKKLELTPEHEAEIVDIMLIENFIFKVSKSFNREAPSSLATEIFASLVNPSTNISKTLTPRPKTIDSIFSVFMKQLHHYNDSNYNRQLLEKRQKNIPNNTPKKSITGSQLQVILPSFIKFMDCLMIHETRGQRKKSIVSNDYVESYNRFIERLYRSTWSDTETSGELTYHKMIIKSGILLYRPKNLIDKRERIVYSEPILKSMETVYEALKNSQSLDRRDVKLMLSLKLIFQLKSTDEAALDKLNSYASTCYLSIP